MRLCLTFTIIASLCAAPAASAADLMDFWGAQQKGGNSFNRLPPDQAYFDALRGYGASWVRLAYDKWKTDSRDFLMGNADRYQGLVARDLAVLRETLDRAERAGLKVVLAPLSLPGGRWSQNNGGRFDDRLWQDKSYWRQAAAFWRDLAKELKDHPAVAAYNIVNEPAPEKKGGLPEHAELAAMKAWYGKAAGTARDLPAFYNEVIAAIREVDPATPVMVDAGWYAAADSFSYWPKPLDDEKVLYSVHMYEPYSATSAPNAKRKKPYGYPGLVPYGGGKETWDAARVGAYLKLPVEWAEEVGLPRNRLVLGEFGCVRTMPFCKQYLEDVLTPVESDGLHWAFYAFREDAWDAMDYELGSGPVAWEYWQAMEEGRPDPVKRSPGPEFDPIRRRLAP